MRAILIDDEELALKYLEHQLMKIGGIEVIKTFMNPRIAVRAAEIAQADLIFLDIQMPEIDGLRLAEALFERNPALNIVFVTAHNEYAVEAFEINALDYILKPVTLERLGNTISRIKSRVQSLKEASAAQSVGIRLFGNAQLMVGSAAAPLKWRTSKAEQLFYYLLHRRESYVEKSAIIELLWPATASEKASQQLYTCVYQMRKTIEPYKENLILAGSAYGYMLRLHKVYTDVEEFQQLLQAEMGEATVANYEKAIALASGEYLEGYDYEWAYVERQRLMLLWTNAAFKLADWYCENSMMGKAIDLCFDIIDRYPLEEKAYFYLMQIFESENNRRKVKATYDKLKDVLKRELDEEPGTEVRAWYFGLKSPRF